jgi:hypothetical protein
MVAKPCSRHFRAYRVVLRQNTNDLIGIRPVLFKLHALPAQAFSLGGLSRFHLPDGLGQLGFGDTLHLGCGFTLCIDARVLFQRFAVVGFELGCGCGRFTCLACDPLLLRLRCSEFRLLTVDLSLLRSHPGFVLGLLLAHCCGGPFLRCALLSLDALTFRPFFGFLLGSGGCGLAFLLGQLRTLPLKRLTFSSESGL